MKLTRKHGVDIYASVGLANPWADTRLDPNGYYARLGLSRDGAWLMGDVRAAYRQRSRELHPDSGDGDAREFNRLSVAYAVLSDPKTRREYDALPEGAVWPDDEVLLAAMKKVRLVPKNGGVEHKKQRVEASTPVEVITNWVEYGYEADPSSLDMEQRQTWIDLFIRLFWDMGFRHEVIRIGFCSMPPHVVQRSWGDIFMLSGEPDDEVARKLIAQAKNLVDF